MTERRYFMRRHNKLMEKSHKYATWHNQPASDVIHWGIFSLAIILKLSLLSWVLFPVSALAASQSWTTTSDFASWSHTNTEAINNSIQLTQSTTSEQVTTESSGLPSARVFTASAFADSTGKAYIFGGRESGSTYLNQIVEFNPTTGAVSTKSATLPSGWHNMSAVYLLVPKGDYTLSVTGPNGPEVTQSLTLKQGIVSHSLTITLK